MIIRDNRQAYIIEIKVSFYNRIKKLTALINSSAVGFIYVDIKTARAIYRKFRIIPFKIIHPKMIRGYNGSK